MMIVREMMQTMKARKILLRILSPIIRKIRTLKSMLEDWTRIQLKKIWSMSFNNLGS